MTEETKKCFMPEEADKFIALGLDPNTRDFTWVDGKPTWSVNKILELFPTVELEFDERGITCNAYGEEGELIIRKFSRSCEQECLYKVVCYLLKNYGYDFIKDFKAISI